MPQTPRKALKITTEIDVHAVSCPGVWLPGRGRCSLSLCLLGFHTRTNKLPPVFPLLFHEKFKFERTFVGVNNLSVLERVLEAETVYLELVQEETSGETVLAVFESSVRDLLFPRPAERLSYSGVDLDLLMEPTRDFPGIISPKIEVSTRTSVSETRTPLHQCAQDNVSFGHAQNRATKAVYRPKSPDDGTGSKGDGGTSSDGPPPLTGTAGRLSPEHDHDHSPQHNSPRHGESSRSGGMRDGNHKPRFAYRRADDDLLSRIPTSPTRNNRYLGIPSRYLSRSAGNLADMPRTSIPSRYGSRHGEVGGGGGAGAGAGAGGLARTSSETEAGGGGGGGGGRYTHPRRRHKDDIGHNAHVTVLAPERCPHCDGEHGAESCTTCRTYHRYFPRPSRPRSHTHAYHTNKPHAALKVLRQPGHRDQRPRKRYLAEINGGYMHGESEHPQQRRARSLSPQRRPTSAPPDRLSLHRGRRARKEVDGDVSGDEDEEEEHGSGSHSRSNSRSPSPPPSHASAPPALTRRRHRSYRRPITPTVRRRTCDSDEESCDDHYVPRRYYHHHYPWEDCPLCYSDYPYLLRYPRYGRYGRYYSKLYRCCCSTCTRYRLLFAYGTSPPPSHYLLHPYHSCYRYKCYYQPYRKSYAREYLDHLEVLDSDDFHPSYSRKSIKANPKIDKVPDATDEDSDLFDSSQVEDIEKGINRKNQVSKHEKLLKTTTINGKFVPRTREDDEDDDGALGRHQNKTENFVPNTSNKCDKQHDLSANDDDVIN